MPKEPSRKLVKSVLPLYHSLLGRWVPDGDRTFFDPADFAWMAELERHAGVIRDEAATALAERDRLPPLHEVEPGQDDIGNESWRSLVLFLYGCEVPENTARFPKTTALLAAVPDITTAMFSVLEPGMHIPAHHGPFKGVLRYHLGLFVPSEGRCGIRVGEQFRRWEEGGSLVFDDTFEHEVWNETGAARVVLFVDFLRPLPPALDAVNRLLMRGARFMPAVRNAQANARRLARAGGDEPR